MVALFRHLFGWLTGVFRSQADLILENLVVRQQLLALHAQRPRPRLGSVKRLFRKALGDRYHPQPRVITTDLAAIYSSVIPDGKKEETLRNRCRHRPVRYLNNILEQDHRAIKRRVNAKQGFREFQAARRTIQG